MELYDLKMFLAVAEEGGFTRAAEKMHCVQPNVTARIKKLEETLGVVLFYRQNRKVLLTPHGKELMVRAKQILRMAADTENSFAADKPVGVLNLGVTQTSSTAWLPEILRRFTKEYPDVEINVNSMFVETIINQLTHHELDCALMEIPTEHSQLAFDYNIPQRLMLVYAKEYDYRPQDGITALSFSKVCTYRKVMYDHFVNKQINVERELILRGMDAVLACVIGGVGVSLLPESVAKMPHVAPHICAHSLGEATHGNMTVLRHKNTVRTAQEQAFSKVAKDVLIESLGAVSN